MNKTFKSLLVMGLVSSFVAANATISIVASNVSFVDISTSGTSVGTATDDSELVITGAALTTAGWTGNALLAGGVSIRVGNNGCILWGNSATDTFTGATEVGYINSTTFMTMAASNVSDKGNGGSGPRQMLAALWDDHTPLSGTGASTQKWQVNSSGDLIIQWSNEDHFNATGTGTVTFQAIIRKSGGSLVDYVYNDTFYATSAYQNDGGSATIGFKNWGVAGIGNDVQYGLGGGTDSTSDPTFAVGTNMQPKVGGWVASANANLTHSVSIVPEPASVLALGLGAVAMMRRRKA